MSSSPSPSNPPPPRPRTTLGVGSRDMLISMAILVPIVLVLAFLARGASFSPGGPSVDQSRMPTVDAHQALVAAARQVTFPLRDPVLPADWRANVVDQRKGPGDADAVRVGWITPGNRYVRLVQSTAEEGALVAAETGGPPGAAVPVRVGSVEWVNYRAANGEQAWAHRADGVEWLITGDGLPAEFSALASAVAAATPMARA